MLRKDQRPFCFTDSQVQELNRINYKLRKLNRSAHDQLRWLGRPSLTTGQYREASESLGNIATQMTSALRFRRQILRTGREQQPSVFVVRYVPSCDHLPSNPTLTELDDSGTPRKAMKPDPAHQTELKSLLEFTSRIEDLVFTRSTVRGATLNAFFRGISRLRLAVLIQQEALEALADEQPFKVEFEDEGPNGCPDCAKSLSIDGMDGH
jgi:hypothetical protein